MQGKAEEKVQNQEARVRACKKKVQYDSEKCQTSFASSQPVNEISDEECKALLEEFKALQSAGNIKGGIEEGAYADMKAARDECQNSIDSIQLFRGKQASLG